MNLGIAKFKVKKGKMDEFVELYTSVMREFRPLNKCSGSRLLTDPRTGQARMVARFETLAAAKALETNRNVQRVVETVRPLLTGLPTWEYYEVSYEFGTP